LTYGESGLIEIYILLKLIVSQALELTFIYENMKTVENLLIENSIILYNFFINILTYFEEKLNMVLLFFLVVMQC